MRCYIDKIVTDRDVVTDIKQLIPDAGLRRRMSKVIKMAVATAIETIGGVEEIDSLDGIITATGWGCLTDSERFLRNIIADKEQLLNPTPFIQSTFNTVGGQIALLRHNHCYNVTFVNRSHSFEDALLDAVLIGKDCVIPFCISQGLVAVLYLYYGYMLKKKRVFAKKFSKAQMVCSVFVCALSLGLAGLAGKMNNMADGVWTAGIISIALDGYIGFVLLYLSLKLNAFKGRVWEWIKKIGSNSLYIFTMHWWRTERISWSSGRNSCRARTYWKVIGQRSS